jgi:hypothetical protein
MSPKDKGELLRNEKKLQSSRVYHSSADYQQQHFKHFLWSAVFPPKWVSTAIDGSLATVYYSVTAAVVAGCALGAVSRLPPKILFCKAVPFLFCSVLISSVCVQPVPNH